jgi:hypothetical protein
MSIELRLTCGHSIGTGSSARASINTGSRITSVRRAHACTAAPLAIGICDEAHSPSDVASTGHPIEPISHIVLSFRNEGKFVSRNLTRRTIRGWTAERSKLGLAIRTKTWECCDFDTLPLTPSDSSTLSVLELHIGVRTIVIVSEILIFKRRLLERGVAEEW